MQSDAAKEKYEISNVCLAAANLITNIRDDDRAFATAYCCSWIARGLGESHSAVFASKNERTARIEEYETVENIRGPCRLINASDSNSGTHWRPRTMSSAFRSCEWESQPRTIRSFSCLLTLFKMTDLHFRKHSYLIIAELNTNSNRIIHLTILSL